MTDNRLSPQLYRRNALAFGMGMALFAVGESIFGANTVIPSYVATLTKSEVLIGLSSGLSMGAWLLPQLFVAGYVTRMECKRPIMVKMALLRGPALGPLALATWLLSERAPALSLAILCLSIILFYGFDACVTVPFMDLMARGLPARKRGRVQGTAAIVGGLGGMAAGVLVRHILAEWAYPASFAGLFAMATAVFTVVGVVHSFIVEPEPDTVGDLAEEAKAAPPSVGEILRSLPSLMRSDHPFLWMILTRVVAGFVMVASAFYVTYATHELGFATADTGLFVSAQVAGVLGNGLITSLVQDRWGPRVHFRLAMVLSMLAPGLTLFAPLAPAGAGVRTLMVVVFFLLGIGLSNLFWPYINWTMEYAPAERRPLYIGVTNTMAALSTLAPVLGGAIVGWAGYPAVFVSAIAFAGMGLLISRKVPSTR